VRSVLTSLCLTLFLAATVFFAPAKAEETAYLSGIEDVPLMEGLAEDTEAGVVFDKPSGRIVEAVAAGKPSPEDVMKFYRATLPELGWKVGMILSGTDSIMFQRDQETLTLSLSRQKDLTVVRFSLAPLDATP